ncbi:hypothetical protein Acor_28900 [Acrocarpospora corrugata]|uniref:Uncharacterized protein n=2 Tax=Acrocarpospora corrugata TaxID=35763 RepID=A0A5M3VWF4_9ACTN|nr:hypothetical protein Acor_28900 [Acrocarpospora corrugata]
MRSALLRQSRVGASKATQECFVYLSDEPASSAVETAVVALAESFGWGVSAQIAPLRGSWFRTFRMKAKDLASTAEAKEIADEIRRAAELHGLHKVQAQNDNLQAQAAATLIQALQGTDQAVLLVGSVLVIKDKGQLAVRTLTQRQLIFLERSADMTQPQKVLEVLELCGNDDSPRPPLPLGEGDSGSG